LLVFHGGPAFTAIWLSNAGLSAEVYQMVRQVSVAVKQVGCGMVWNANMMVIEVIDV
tara:strand:- start:648 stop:818 length:171 start_codon:yes stop_codon:yes gene_type:complete